MTMKLRERGCRILYEDRHPFAGGNGHYALYTEDPDRIKVELAALEAGGSRRPAFVRAGLFSINAASFFELKLTFASSILSFR